MKALSLRQPWAYLVTNGPNLAIDKPPGKPWKPVENREWQTDKNHFGKTLIHASSGMTKEEFVDCRSFVVSLWEKNLCSGKLTFPAFNQLERGGIVGEVEIIGYMRRVPNNIKPRMAKGVHAEDLVPFRDSPWFFGTVGICLRNCRPLPFQKCKGMLGFFTPAL